MRKPENDRPFPPFSKTAVAGSGGLRGLLKDCLSDPELRRRYARARKFRDITRHACNYDMTSRCNLYCEGCFYFEGDAQTRLRENTDIAVWDDFFRRQARDRGIGYGYFAGAEPALEQDRLHAAAKYIKRGSISTNGTVRIDESLPYTILVSVWGDEEETEKFRGGGTFWKAIRNFARDPRARFIYTLNRNNLASAARVAHILDAEGARFAFNYYSPTSSYLQKISSFHGNDDAFFRISSSSYHLHFLPEDLPHAHDAVNRIIDDYPRSCLHTKELNRWMTLGGSRYDIDAATGIAVNCGGRNNHWHQAYGVDMKPAAAKCCTPNVDCSECRLYAPALSTLLFRREAFAGGLGDFRAWLAMCEQWGRLFLTDQDWADEAPQAESRTSAA